MIACFLTLSDLSRDQSTSLNKQKYHLSPNSNSQHLQGWGHFQTVDCSLQVGGELLSQARELKYGGDNGAWDGRAADKAHDLPVLHFPTLTCYRELWTMAKRMISWIQAAGMSLLQRVAGHRSRCFLFFARSQLRCVGNLIRMPPGRLPLEIFWGPLTGRTLRQNTLGGDYISHLAWECNSMEELGTGVSGISC